MHTCTVVVWCRKEELYNIKAVYIIRIRLWFDVEKKNYTTLLGVMFELLELWFDVEKKNYTTK